MTSGHHETPTVPIRGSSTVHSSATISLESWRVISQAVEGSAPTVEAVVRIRADEQRVIANDEGTDVTSAMESSIRGALLELVARGELVDPHAVDRLQAQAGLAAGPDESREVAVRLTALHDDAMLTRVVALLGPHQVGGFSYEPDGRGHASIEVGVLGGPWQVDRVATKLGRVVGVLDVAVDR